MKDIVDKLLITLAAATLAFCAVLVTLKYMGYIDPSKALREDPVASEYTIDNPFIGYISAESTIVQNSIAYLDEDGDGVDERVDLGYTQYIPLWQYNDESWTVLSNTNDIAMLNAVIHKALHNESFRADVIRHGYVTEQQLNDALLMFPDEFNDDTDGVNHVTPDTE